MKNEYSKEQIDAMELVDSIFENSNINVYDMLARKVGLIEDPYINNLWRDEQGVEFILTEKGFSKGFNIRKLYIR